MFSMLNIFGVVANVATSGTSNETAVLGRRTQRTRRARPHFFDSLEYGTHVRRVHCFCIVLQVGLVVVALGWLPKRGGFEFKI